VDVSRACGLFGFPTSPECVAELDTRD
jgi:hypothetical protein